LAEASAAGKPIVIVAVTHMFYSGITLAIITRLPQKRNSHHQAEGAE
jgi:hypothetical protein